MKLRRVASLRNEPSAPGAPLTLQTKGDQWLHTEATRLLAANERVLEQAYGYNGEEERQITKSLFVVVTDRRVLVIESRLGTTPRLENNGLTAHERVAIEAVTTDERRVTFLFPGGAVLEFFAEWSQRHFSNQRRFLRDVPRMLGNAEPQLESAHGAEPVAAATE